MISGMTSRTSRDRVLAGLLVLALLLCHGVFGSMHLSHDSPVAPSAMEGGGHAGHHGAAAGQDGNAMPHHGGMAPEYFAVFLAVFFGSVFLLLRSKPAVSARGASLRSFILSRTVLLHPPARGPTLPYLQVFRL